MIQARALRSRAFLAATILLPLLAPPSARAQFDEPLYLSATNKFDYRRLSTDTQRDEALRNRLEVTAFQGIFSLWMRLETLQLSDATAYDPYGAGDDDFLQENPGEEQPIDATEISRRAFTIEDRGLKASIGDFANVFGRGLMLSVFEEEELNFDTRLDGILASAEHDLGTATALAGSDRGNRFRGVFAEPSAWKALRVGGGFVEAWGGEGDVRARETHWGVLGELSVLSTETIDATIYGEHVQREFAGRAGEGYEPDAGRGTFGSAVVTVKDVTLSGEYRDYFKFEYDYHDPPTTLRQHTWTLLNRHNAQILVDIPDDDVRGALVEAEYSYDFFTHALGSWSTLDQRDAANDFGEVYVEARGNWREQAFLTLAADESELNFDTLFDERISGMGELVVHLDPVNSLTFGVEWSEIRQQDAATSDFEPPFEFRERIFSASYGLSPWLNLTAVYEDTTEDDPDETSDHWLSLLAEITLNDNHVLNLAVGSERGGWKCNGGICFFEPEFEGLKIRWVARY